MQYFLHEPTFGDMPSGQATSSVINSNTSIGREVVADDSVTSGEFCHAKGLFLGSAYYGRTNKTIAYYDDGTETWKTKSEKPIHQILCVDATEATTTVNVTMASGTINLDGGYNGPSYNEWLFIAGIIIFFLSFIFWGKVSFTNVK